MTPLPIPTDPGRPARTGKKSRWPILASFVVAVAVAIGLFGIYGIDRLKRNAAEETACMAAVDIGNRIAPLARGEVAALNVATRPLKLPNLAFADAEGRPKHLSDWRGRFALVNLWATWCVPCRKEMPALQSLQAKLGGGAFEVVAINIDTRDTENPKKWLAESGITGLAYYSDSKAKTFQDLKAVGRAFGMPTTILMDREGCEIGAMAGAAEWASEDAIRLISAAINP
jgi:thiol-disulfide isomerase/thioredoxin